MKKAVSLLLALVLCLSLCACGKSEAVKNVEAMIDALGEITLESIDAIRSVESAYNALTEDEQKKVNNYETLTEARDAYYELALVGDWCVYYIDLYDVEGLFKRLDFQLNDDMTGTSYMDDGETEASATWSVENCVVNIDCGQYGCCAYTVVEKDGKLLLEFEADPNRSLMHVADFRDLLDEIFLVVDLSEVDISEFCGISLYQSHVKDAWGEPTGDVNSHIYISNLLVEQGWLYLHNSNDIAIEVLYPEYYVTQTEPDGNTYTYTHYSGSDTIRDNPFTHLVGVEMDNVHKGHALSSTLNKEQLSFGRAKGTIVYINTKFVTEVKYLDRVVRVIVTPLAGTECPEFASGTKSVEPY